jgi:hypothetical protein
VQWLYQQESSFRILVCANRTQQTKIRLEIRFLFAGVGSKLAPSLHIDAACVGDVSEVYSASIFRVKVIMRSLCPIYLKNVDNIVTRMARALLSNGSVNKPQQ